MAYLTVTCPHCLTPQAPLASKACIAREENLEKATGFFLCPICEKPVGAWLCKVGRIVGANSPSELQNWTKTVEAGGWVAVNVWPEATETPIPEDVPENIGRNFVQAEEAARRELRETAGMAYRRSLELTLKDKAPDLKGTLEKRINRLADDGRLTKDMAD